MNEQQLAVNRRRFLAGLPAAGIMSALMPGALAAVAQDAGEVTVGMLAAARSLPAPLLRLFPGTRAMACRLFAPGRVFGAARTVAALCGSRSVGVFALPGHRGGASDRDVYVAGAGFGSHIACAPAELPRNRSGTELLPGVLLSAVVPLRGSTEVGIDLTGGIRFPQILL